MFTTQFNFKNNSIALMSSEKITKNWNKKTILSTFSNTFF